MARDSASSRCELNGVPVIFGYDALSLSFSWRPVESSGNMTGPYAHGRAPGLAHPRRYECRRRPLSSDCVSTRFAAKRSGIILKCVLGIRAIIVTLLCVIANWYTRPEHSCHSGLAHNP